MNIKLKLALTTPIIVLPFLAQAETPALTQYTTTITDLHTIQKKLQSNADEAKTDSDSIKYVCISDRLRLVSGIIEQTSSRYEQLNTAVSTGDTEATSHNLLIIKEYLRRAELAADEADLCLGAELIRNSEEQIKYEVDDTIVTPDLDLPTPSIVTEPPACASCYR